MPSYFQHAHNFVFNGTIVNTGSYTLNGSTRDHVLESLVNNITVGAMHNSEERCDAPKCHAETRVAVQQEIFSWVRDGEKDDEPKKVLWMSGPAGTGKTAIAGSIAELCKEEGLLAASFFFSSFSGSRERCSKRRLISTIAYQLLLQVGLQGVGLLILDAVKRNPVVFRLGLGDQLEELVLAPLRDAMAQGTDVARWPKVILIDGLDEVEPDQQEVLRPSEVQRLKDETYSEILATLMRAARDTAFPFRIIVVSRPEKAIRNFFASESVKGLTREVFLDEKYNPDADIELFLRSKFAEIRRSYDIPLTWPLDDVIRRLVDNASGQFIYAATVIRYVSDAANPPQTQLDHVLNLQATPSEAENPLATLHALYTRILNSSPNPQLAVKWIRIMDKAGLGLPALFWKQFLESSPGEAGYLLSNLTSLISIPPAADRVSPFRFYHKTLMDFLESVPPEHPLYASRWFGENSIPELVSIRLIQILKGKGPAVPLSEAEREAFTDNLFASYVLQQFVPRIGRYYSTTTPGPGGLTSLRNDLKQYSRWTSLPNSEADVLNCDVEWWIQRLISRYGSIRATTPSSATNPNPWVGASEILAGLFWEVHVQCRWYLCLPVCKHWRSAILKVCQSHGWSVPGRSMLLRNRFIRWDGSRVADSMGESCLTIFPCGWDFSPPPLYKEDTAPLRRKVTRLAAGQGQLKVPGAAVFPLS
ncbi:hypothetical protein NMY22_g15580 [Coprinellus aureogranulatus]|nr:hypothetical protein NMY22_g15580 [Coprinellus aureogranulatus]